MRPKRRFAWLLLAGFKETIGGLDNRDLDFRLIPAIHGQVAVGSLQAEWCRPAEKNVLGGSDFKGLRLDPSSATSARLARKNAQTQENGGQSARHILASF